MKCPFVASQKNVPKILDGYEGEYPCLASRDHNDDHVVEVEPGKTLAIPKLSQGRPMSTDPLSERVMVRLTPEDVERLDDARGEKSRSEMVRDCVREAIKENA